MAKVLRESPEPVTIIPTGPETNVAALLLAHPELKSKIKQISLMGGGIAYGKETVDAISEMVGWIAPITVYPGEDELLALAQGALRVLKGEEKAQEYRRPRPDDNK